MLEEPALAAGTGRRKAVAEGEMLFFPALHRGAPGDFFPPSSCIRLLGGSDIKQCKQHSKLFCDRFMSISDTEVFF